jgi:hypothetical protein
LYSRHSYFIINPEASQVSEWSDLRMKYAHHRRGLRIGGLGLAIFVASLTPAGAQTLAEALADAYATNPTLGAARAGRPCPTA